MENTSRLAFATFLARESLQFRLTKLEWPIELGVPIYDYQASIILDGEPFVGRGVHESEALCIEIAIAEAFERSIFRNKALDPRFGGLAVHTDPQKASQAATLELIERDAFFCHFLTSAPMKPMSELQDLEIEKHLRRLCLAYGIQLSSYSLVTPPGYFAHAIVLRGNSANRNPFGIRIGLGCSNVDVKSSLEKAAREALPMLAHVILTDKIEPMTAEELLAKQDPKPEHHRNWAFHEASWKSMESCFPPVSTVTSETPLDPSKVFTKEVARPNSWPSLIPLVAAAAYHPDSARTFFGDNRKASIFSRRIAEFSGKAFDENLLPALPHPLG